MEPLRKLKKYISLYGILPTLLILSLSPLVSSGQKKVYYSFLPFGISVPGGGRTFFTSTTAGFYLADRENTSMSTISFAPYIAFNGRFGYNSRSNCWLKGNKWNVMGDMRVLYYPQTTWGLGGYMNNSRRLSIDYKYTRFYQTILREIKPGFLVGLGYHIDAHYDIDTGNDTISLERFAKYRYGTTPTEKSFSSGLSVNMLYDQRRNSNDPHPGFYGNIVYRFNPSFLGSNTNWQSLYLDTRRYIPFSHTRKNMLAFWTFYWTALDKKTPFLDLPSVGWDPYQQRSGRGFPQNRYRGKSLLYFETEYRRDITSDGILGFVLFTNLNSVTEPSTDHFSYLHAAYGGGLRIKFSKNSRTNIAIDYGRSKGASGISLNLGETF